MKKVPSTRDQGTQAETRAADFLIAQGLQILDRQFTRRTGEIDVIATDGREIVFVEVKMRRTAVYGTALEAVTQKKLQKIQRTALQWLQIHGREQALYRFDVIAIEGDLIEWIKGVY